MTLNARILLNKRTRSYLISAKVNRMSIVGTTLNAAYSVHYRHVAVFQGSEQLLTIIDPVQHTWVPTLNLHNLN